MRQRQFAVAAERASFHLAFWAAQRASRRVVGPPARCLLDRAGSMGARRPRASLLCCRRAWPLAGWAGHGPRGGHAGAWARIASAAALGRLPRPSSGGEGGGGEWRELPVSALSRPLGGQTAVGGGAASSLVCSSVVGCRSRRRRPSITSAARCAVWLPVWVACGVTPCAAACRPCVAVCVIRVPPRALSVCVRQRVCRGGAWLLHQASTGTGWPGRAGDGDGRRGPASEGQREGQRGQRRLPDGPSPYRCHGPARGQRHMGSRHSTCASQSV